MGVRRDSRIGAVILAAGRSARMGEPKQLLHVGGKTLLEQALQNVRGSTVCEIVLVLGFAAETIAKRVSVERTKVVVNQDYRHGLGSSLRAGLSALDPLTNAALIVLADQPLVRSKTLDRLIDRYQKGNAQILVPTYQGFRGNPILLDRSVFPEVIALSGDIGCRAIFGNHPDTIRKVPVDDIGILIDIDTKDDFAKLQRIAQGEAGRRALIEAADLRGREIPQGQQLSCDQGEIIIVGGEPSARALVRLAKLMRFTVIVLDPLLQAGDVPDADHVFNALDLSHSPAKSDRYVVVASGGRFDEEAVEQAFAINSNYVALIANHNRAQELRHRLESKGHSAGKLATLHAPAGLEIGAKTPEEIALSILAEIICVKRRGETKGFAGRG